MNKVWVGNVNAVKTDNGYGKLDIATASLSPNEGRQEGAAWTRRGDPAGRPGNVLDLVSHDIRTPLTVIKGAVAIALGSHHQLPAEETTELLQIIDEQADRLNDLVDNLLDMVRLQQGPFRVTLGPAEQASAPCLSMRAWRHGKVARPGQRTRIMAIDDDPHIVRFLRRSLEDAGYEPVVSTDPEDTVRLMETHEPDLVLLDLMFPNTTGFDLLQRLREFSGVPVIFLSSCDGEEHTVHALKLGADDYITKPFSNTELLARIEAALRRRVAADMVEALPPFVLDGLAIDFAQRAVTRSGAPVPLSPTEYKVLYELATNAGRVLTHDQLLQRVWGEEYSGETELLRSMVRSLRRKLNDDARRPTFIHTVPQVGYRLSKPS